MQKIQFQEIMKDHNVSDLKNTLLIAARGPEESCYNKRSYASFIAAKEAARSSGSPTRTTVYKCHFCKQWHYAHKPTIQEIDAYESSASQEANAYAWRTGYENACDGKVRFESKINADTTNLIHGTDSEMQSYPCPYCHKWHLGHVRGSL